MAVEQIVYKLAEELANTPTQTNEEQSSASIGPFIVTDEIELTHANAANSNSIVSSAVSHRANDFMQALDTSHMLVKSIKTRELKTIDAKSLTILPVSTDLNAYEVQDNRVMPKRNYSRVDMSKVNIFSHRGPDEYKNITGGAL